MKKTIKSISIIFLLFAAAFIGGCDKFDSLPLNVPFSMDFNVNNAQNFSFKSPLYCLDEESQVYKDNQEKIKNLSYLKSSLNISDISDTSLSFNLNVKVYDKDDNQLFAYSVNNFRPADYMNKSYELQLSQTDIIALNNYFKNLSNNCFSVEISIENVNSSASVSGSFNGVLEAETEL